LTGWKTYSILLFSEEAGKMKGRLFILAGLIVMFLFTSCAQGNSADKERNIITGNGPQAAEKFGEEIVKALTD
jgi:putative intracellular protease/amidase